MFFMMTSFQAEFLKLSIEKYETLKLEIWEHFQKTYLPVDRVYEFESEMLPFLKKEYNRARWYRWKGVDPLLEIRKLVQFFYYRERGEKISLKEMNPYVRDFLSRHNSRIFSNPPFNGKPVHDAIVELLNQRLLIPHAAPEDVFKNWLPNQFKRALDNLPEPILEDGGFGKVCRVIGGVFLYALTGLDGVGSYKLAKARMEQALKGGYYFGMFYPLIDDVFDHPEILSSKDKHQLVELLEHWIVGDFTIENVLKTNPTISLLEEILREFHLLFPLEKNETLYVSAMMLFLAQIEDGRKSFDETYSVSELYVPIIIKAAYTRILAASISGITVNEDLLKHMKMAGLNLQMMDDFRDWFSDYKTGQFTPFTYYMKGPHNQEINPFSLYLISLRIHFANFHDDPFFVNMLMKRLVISIQRLSDDNTNMDLEKKVWNIISHNSEVGEIVRKIHTMRYRVFDPDIEFTRPVDNVVNRGQ